MNTKTFTCAKCGYQWEQGTNGSHSCAGNLEVDAKRWRALMSSERIRIIGTSGIGSPEYQHVGLEVWSAFSDAPEPETVNSQEVLTKYADTIIRSKEV